MSQSLTGSRYELHVARKGALRARRRTTTSRSIQATSRRSQEGDDVDRLRPLRASWAARWTAPACASSAS